MNTDEGIIIKQKLDRPIVLVGMMGAGKSHLGWSLAELLGLDYFDSDKVIEEKAGQSIPEIFENYGEGKFRDSEHKTIIELIAKGPCVIATGGGALMDEKTLKALKAQSVMIWLNASIDTLWARVQKSHNRPLLNTQSPKETLEALLESRKVLYSQAHIEVKADGAREEKPLSAIIKALSAHLNGDTV